MSVTDTPASTSPASRAADSRSPTSSRARPMVTLRRFGSRAGLVRAFFVGLLVDVGVVGPLGIDEFVNKRLFYIEK